MLAIALRTAAGNAILLIMPVILWLLSWNWQPQNNNNPLLLNILFLISETANQPLVIIIHTLFCALFWCYLRYNLRSTIIMCIIFCFTIVIGQGLKFYIKNSVQKPRPFVILLKTYKYLPFSIEDLYKLKYKESLIFLKNKKQLSEKQKIPDVLLKYWQKNKGFSLPSGHTIFATSWTLLSIGLLWPIRKIITILIFLLWNIAVMISRLLLGMHSPIDLIFSIELSWLLVIFPIWLIQSTCKKIYIC